MSEPLKETTLAKARLHWGIFILPILAIIPIELCFLPIAFFIHFLSGILAQINPQGGHSVSVLYLGAFLVPIIPVLLVLLLLFVAYLNSEITLTNRRLIYRTGFVTRISGEMPLENVDTVFIIEPLIGRAFGYGTVIVTSVGGLRFPFRYIGAPQNFHSVLQQAVNRAKNPTPLPKKVSVQTPDDDSRYMPKG